MAYELTPEQLAAAQGLGTPLPYNPTLPISASNPFNYADLKAYQATQQNNQPTTNGGLAPGVVPPDQATEDQAPPPAPRFRMDQGDNASPGLPPPSGPDVPPASIARPPDSPKAPPPAAIAGGSSLLSQQSKDHQQIYGDVGKTLQSDIDLAGMHGTVASQLAQQEGSAYGDFGSQIDKLNATKDASWKKAVDSYQQRQQQLQDQMNDIKNVDPNHYWNEKGTAAKIGMALAVGLGAFGAAVPHTANHVNYAYDIMNNAINQDISAQKDNIKSQWNKVTQGMEVNKDDMARAAWEREQMSKEKEFALLKLNSTLAKYQAGAKSQDSILTYTELQNKIQRDLQTVKMTAVDDRFRIAQAQAAASNSGRLKMVKDYQDLINKYYDERNKGNNPPAPPSFGEFAGTQTGQAVPETPGGGRIFQTIDQVPGKDRDKAILLPDGTVRIAPDAGSKKEYDTRSSAGTTWDRNLAELKDIDARAKSRAGFMSPDDMISYERIRHDLKFAYPSMTEGVARQPNQPEGESFDTNVLPEAKSMVGNIASYVVGGGLSSSIRNLEQVSQNSKEAAARIVGAPIAKRPEDIGIKAGW